MSSLDKMACNNVSFENEDFDSLDESQIALMHPQIEEESPIKLFREKMELERQAMARNFVHAKELIDNCEREFLESFDQACLELEREIGEREVQLKSIQQTTQEMSISMKENSLISTLQIAQQPLLTKLQQLENEIAILSDLKMKFDAEGFEQRLRPLCTLTNPIEELEFEDAIPIPDDNVDIPGVDGAEPKQNGIAKPYTDRRCVWSAFKSDSSTEGLINARGVTVCEKTGTIFVSDHGNHRIQVCTPDGQFIRSILHRDMSYPLYSVIGLNHKEITVSSHHALIKFSYEGEFLATCPLSRSSCRGLDKDDQGMIYACEWRNYIIVIHDPVTLKVTKRFKLQTNDISTRRKLNDIKIRGEFVYVLFTHNSIWSSFPYKEYPLQVYDKKGIHVRSIAGGSLLQKPVCFAVDGEGNWLVTEYWKSTIVVISDTGALLGNISQSGQGRGDVSYPTGICVTKEGTVLVVSTGKTENILQAF